MKDAEEYSPLPREGKTRVALAWLSWWFMLSSGAGISAFAVGAILFYFIGGPQLLSAVWVGKEEGNYLWVITASAAGVPTGALLGARLWSRLMRRTGWISAERIKRMSGL